MKAFSLIELIVVIAVVALLSAIAVPTYKQYVKRSKIDTTFTQAAAVADKIKIYYSKNGVFPFSGLLEAVGYPTSFTQVPNSAAEYAVPPYISNFQAIGNNSAPGLGVCVNFSVEFAISNLDNSGAYTSSNSYPIIYVIIDNFLTGDNNWASVCGYTETLDAGGPETGSSVITNCYNRSNPAEFAELTDEYNALSTSCP